MAAGLAAAPAARAALPGGFWGLNIQELVKNSPTSDWPGWFDRLQGLGVSVARTDFMHEDYEDTSTSPATYRWDRGDLLFTQLATRGIRVRAVLIDRAAHPGAQDGPFVAFARAFAQRYAAGGAFWAAHPELPQLPVQQVEVWNEPNTSRWNGPPDPAAYWNLFSPTRDAIKSVSPGTAVLLGGLAWNDINAYLRGIWDASGHDWRLDGIGYHPWGDTAGAVVGNVQKIADTLRSIGQPGLPLYLTEIGWLYDDAHPAAHARDGGTRDAERAGSQSLAVDALANSDCSVAGIDLYDFVESEIGVVAADGSTTVAGQAYADSTRRPPMAGGPLSLCAPQASPAGPRLPLDLSVAQDAGACQHIVGTYLGHPVEGIDVFAQGSGPDARPTHFAAAGTLADGTAGVCGAAGGSVRVRVWGEVKRAARSGYYTCPSGTQGPCAPAAIHGTSSRVAPDADVTLDASDFAPAHFTWDLDGDGRFETDGGTSPIAHMTAGPAGSTTTVALRVDADARSDVVTTSVVALRPGQSGGDVTGAVAGKGKVCALGIAAPRRVHYRGTRARVRTRIVCDRFKRSRRVGVYRVFAKRRAQLLRWAHLRSRTTTLSLRARWSRARIMLVVRGVRHRGAAVKATTTLVRRAATRRPAARRPRR